MNDTCDTHRSRVPRRSFGRIKRGVMTVKDEIGLLFVFCVRQSSVRGCRLYFVFVYFIFVTNKSLTVCRFPPPSSRSKNFIITGLAPFPWLSTPPHSSHLPFSIHSAFQNMQAAHTICTYIPYHQRCWLLN